MFHRRSTMAKCERNSMGSSVIDEHDHTRTGTNYGRHFRQLSSFFASSLRRKVFEAVSCGGSSQYCSHEFGAVHNPTMTEAPVNEKSALEEKQNWQRRGKKEVVVVVVEKEEEEEKRNDAALSSKSESEVKNRIWNEDGNVKSAKLVDLLNLPEAGIKTEARKKVEALEELKRVVKELQEGDLEMARVAASKVRVMAKDDAVVRGTLAMLGAIPPLVGMLDLEDVDSQIASLYALLNLGIGNDENKASIVKAGAIHVIMKIIESPGALNASVYEAIIANFLGLSALDSNKPIIGYSGAVSFLVKSLQNTDSNGSLQATQDALRALYNLSIFSANISPMLKNDLVPFLLNNIGNMAVSERILAILTNLVSTPEGRKAISILPDAFPILVDVLNWTDSPNCQEKASYILMVMAYKSYSDRQAMIEAGIASSLLELTLLGSTLAQKRASRLLEYLRVDKGKQVSNNYSTNLIGNVSAPYSGSVASSAANPIRQVNESNEHEDTMSLENKAIKHLVQQSLQSNMRRIVKRANLPQDFIPSDHLKSLTSSSTSKSLPF